MKCHRCYREDISVGITREVPEQNSRIRTYKCNSCGNVFMTSEYLYVPSIRIMERDGTKPYLRPEWLRQQLNSLVNLYDDKLLAPRKDLDEDIYRIVEEACRVLYYKNKKKVTRAELDKIILKSLEEQYPLLCIAYYLKYVIIEKNKVPKYFRQLINQFTKNYAKEKQHARKLALQRDYYKRKRNKSNPESGDSTTDSKDSSKD